MAISIISLKNGFPFSSRKDAMFVPIINVLIV